MLIVNYRATLYVVHGTSRRPVSVCLSVRHTHTKDINFLLGLIAPSF